jgi:3-isopropylmalate dehydrogenase
MMMEYLGEDAAAAAIEKGIRFVVAEKLKSLSAGKMGYSTMEVGDLVVQSI